MAYIITYLIFHYLTGILCHHAFAPGFRCTWTSDSENVTFTVIAKTRGWIGFGVSPDGGMAGSDIAIGGVKDDGTPYFGDYYMTGNIKPTLDEWQDWHLLSYIENGTHTSLKFTRKLETCDKQDWKITRDSQRLIYAWGETDELAYHGKKRGVKQKMLMDPQTEVDISRFHKFDLHTSVILSPKPVSCHYTLHKTPNFASGDVTVAGVSSVFNLTGITNSVVSAYLLHDNDDLPSEISREYAHNVNLYLCQAQDADVLHDWLSDAGTGCGGRHHQLPMECSGDAVIGWSTGFHITIFPENVGYTLSTDSYYLLETQYVNPRNLSEVMIDTGHRLYYTEAPRKHEAGYLMIGSAVNYTQVIPPGSQNFLQISHCSPLCTSNWPSEGLTVFATKFRAHKGAKGLKVRIFRDGVELPWITNDFRVDYNYKEIRVLREEMKLFPGDHITVECLYSSTSNKRKVSVGGVNAWEMCMAYFYYYPKFPYLVECRSQPMGQPILDFFGINMTKKQGYAHNPLPETLEGEGYLEFLRNFHWTTESRSIFQDLHRHSQHEVECRAQFGKKKGYTTYPKMDKEWDMEDLCRKQSSLEARDSEHGGEHENDNVGHEEQNENEHGEQEHEEDGHDHGDGHEHEESENVDHPVAEHLVRKRGHHEHSSVLVEDNEKQHTRMSTYWRQKLVNLM